MGEAVVSWSFGTQGTCGPAAPWKEVDNLLLLDDALYAMMF